MTKMLIKPESFTQEFFLAVDGGKSLRLIFKSEGAFQWHLTFRISKHTNAGVQPYREPETIFETEDLAAAVAKFNELD